MTVPNAEALPSRTLEPQEANHTGALALLGIGRVGPVAAVQFTFRIAVAALGLVSTWFTRFTLNEDGMSYLDLGREFWHGNWRWAVNRVWSPLYAWLNGLITGLVHPSLKWEFPFVHLVNLGLLIAALFGFEFCWREMLRFAHQDREGSTDQAYLWASAYLLFIYIHWLRSSGLQMDVALVTPDLMVATLCYIASGLVLRVCRIGPTMKTGAELGAVLGVGYLAKSTMLPFAVVVFLSLFWCIRKRKGAIASVATGLLAFSVIAAPLITVFSISDGHLSFGDSAALNQAWHVNGVRPMYRHWQGTPGHPPEHPTRAIFRWPEAFEFATPVPGTYPVWLDPEYWEAGVDTSFHARAEWAAISRNLLEYRKFVLGETPFLTAILMVVILSQGSLLSYLRRIGTFWPILLPALCMFLTYALVHWEHRYTTAFETMAAATVFAATSAGTETRSVNLKRGAVLALGIVALCSTTMALLKARVENWSASAQVDIAQGLQQMGLRPGESIAIIGDGFDDYWAHLAQLHIVAEVPHDEGMRDSAAAFWSAPSSTQVDLLTALERTGARAVIGGQMGFARPPGWIEVGKTGFLVYFFR